MSTPAIADEPKVSVPMDRLRWSWEAEDATVKVQLPLDLVARLRRDIEKEPRRSTSEIGGVLLGRTGEREKVEVEDYIWIESDEVRISEGASEYILDIAALQPLREARPDLMILGYFRTQLEGALHLRLAETDFVTGQFHDRSNVVLLIRPGEQFKAGFMTWKGDTFLPFSVGDFPFQAEALRESATLIPVEAPAAEVEASEHILAVPAIERYAPAAATASRRNFKIRIKIKSRTETKQYIKRLAFGFGSLAAAGALSGFAVMDQFLPTTRIEPPKFVASVPLELQAEAQEHGLEVRWNPDSKPVARAREGRLALIDLEGKSEIIPLNGYQLASGHLELPSGKDAVEVRLEVVDQTGATIRESFGAMQLWPEPKSFIEARPMPVAEVDPNRETGANERKSTPAETTVSEFPSQEIAFRAEPVKR